MKAECVALVNTHNNLVLLVQQRKFKYYGMWTLPGGHREAGDISPEEALIREVNEELGVHLDNSSFGKLMEYQQPTESGYLTIHTYYTMHKIWPLKLNGNELLAYGWFSLESLGRIELQSPMIIQQVSDALLFLR